MQTVSLELSKALKEAGYPQVGVNWWVHISHYLAPNTEVQLEHRLEIERLELQDCDVTEIAYSPTADEILEQLPSFVFINGDHYALDINRPSNKANGGDWFVRYVYPNFMTDSSKQEYECDLSLADAAAKMWLYLKKEGLL